ncbi:unnamed protein product [Coregonus sp. 'balchen']|nr:unnamed protein product [Coregonus sp. 'balchen']
MGQTASCLAAKEQHNRQSADSLSLRERKQRDREKCVSLVLWKKPLVTLHYFLLELLITLKDWKWRHHKASYGDKDILSSLLVLVTLFSIAYSVEGKHQKYVQHMEKRFLWCAYWVGLGILSSVGLGTGLHTFLLYLNSVLRFPQ